VRLVMSTMERKWISLYAPQLVEDRQLVPNLNRLKAEASQWVKEGHLVVKQYGALVCFQT